MNAPATSSPISYGADLPKYAAVPLLHLPVDQVQTYFQTLGVYDTLRYRFSDLDDPKWDDVIGIIQRVGKQMYMVLDQYQRVVAEFMLEGFTGQSAQIHFSFHPELLTIQEKFEVGKYVLRTLFHDWTDPKTEKPFLQSVYGLTPLPNRVACIFALKAGFKKLGILPGGCKYLGGIEDAMISVASNG